MPVKMISQLCAVAAVVSVLVVPALAQQAPPGNLQLASIVSVAPRTPMEPNSGVVRIQMHQYCRQLCEITYNHCLHVGANHCGSRYQACMNSC